MKARPIPDLVASAPTRAQIGASLGARLTELYTHAAGVNDPSNVAALHDMRIAGKRLRYALEALASCLPPQWPDIVEHLKALQDRLGEIRDFDIGMQLVRRELATTLRRMRTATKRLDLHVADDRAPATLDDLAHSMQHGEARGLVELLRTVHIRRATSYAEFTAFWNELDSGGLRARIEALWAAE